MFVYWSNKEMWHGSKLAEIKAKNILEADKLFQEQTGLDPSKIPWIGCAMGDDNLSLIKAEIAHIKEKVDGIDLELKSMKLGARIAVLEDRQKIVFSAIYGITGLFGTVISGIIIWLFTH